MAALPAERGPTLPALLRRQFGIPPVLTLAVAAVGCAAAVVAIVLALTQPPSPGAQALHDSAPVFNLLYPPDAMRQVRPRRGELLRLQGRRGQLTVEVVVRRLELPPYEGDVVHGLLPVLANRVVEANRAQTPGFELVSEGRERMNDAVGYEIGFRAVRPDRRLYGRDTLLVPDEPEEGHGPVTLSVRQRKAAGQKLTPAERGLAFTSRKTYRSFHFGTGRD